MTKSQPSHTICTLQVHFQLCACYDLQSLGYNVGHGLSVVHGPSMAYPLTYLIFFVLALFKRKKIYY